MNFTKSVVALALSMGVVAGANAMDHDLGTVSAPSTYSAVTQVGVGSFSDKWIFDVSSPLQSAGSASILNISINGMPMYTITDLSVQLFDSGDNLIVNLDNNPGSSADYKVGSGVFPVANDYYFAVSGNATGSLGGQYVFAVSTLPVPEPETYAMLLAGLGIIGAVARRRNVK
jgi:hypothetical protein